MNADKRYAKAFWERTPISGGLKCYYDKVQVVQKFIIFVMYSSLQQSYVYFVY